MTLQTRSQPSGRQTLIHTAYFGFVLLGMNGVLVSSLIRSLERDFHQSDAAFGLLYLLGSLLFGAGAFSSGFLTERFGRKIVLAIGAGVAVGGLVIMAATSLWPLFLAASAASGWGAAVLDAGINALALDLYRSERGAALNLLHLFFGIGALISPFLIGAAVSAGLGWRLTVLASAALFAFLLLAFAVLAMPSGRDDRTARSAENSTQPEQGLFVPFLWLAVAIALYVAAEVGVSNWLVRLLAAQPLIAATATLSLFWGGLAFGRLLSFWLAERFNYALFTIACMLLASLALAGAVLAPWPLDAALFALTGLLYGPIYPMIMALGGHLYPQRLAALSGSLTTAATVGSVVYPPLMGLMASRIGLPAGMMGAALLGIPAALSVLALRPAMKRGDEETGARPLSIPRES